jgi:hypothetical protein
MISKTKKMQFIHHRARGESFDRISQAIDVSKPTLIKLAREFADEIDDLEEAYMNDLLECYRLSVTKQIALYRERLNTIQEQLKDKKMAALGTTELVNLELKYFKALNQLVGSYNSHKSENRKEKLRRMESEQKEKDGKVKSDDQKNSSLSLKEDSPDDN